MAGIAPEKFLEGGASVSRLIQVIFVDFSNGKQGIWARLATRILAAQKLVLFDGGAQQGIVLELPAHLKQQFRCGDDTGIRLGAGGAPEINAAVSINYTLVIVTAALALRLRRESFAQASGVFKFISCPGLARGAGGCGQYTNQKQGKGPDAARASPGNKVRQSAYR